MEYSKLKETYELVIKRHEHDLSKEALSLIDRGLVISDNQNIKDDKVILLTGINPSFRGALGDGVFCFSAAEDGGRSHYWFKKHKQFGATKEDKGDLVQNHLAYLDLFPFRESNQMVFEKTLKDFNAFRFEVLLATQKAVHDLKPRLIVHANKSSLYYWGLDFVSHCDDTVNPWLGYHFEKMSLADKPGMEDYLQRVSSIEERKRFVHLFRMSGNGITPCYFLTYMMENYRMKPEQKLQLLSPTEMVNLCNHFLK